ncbi:MAG: phosphoadenosine phosphosulfate reductase family protein [Leptolyngbya sp. SIOISBB]|nr:phosphoadenosine phosphosulfate reductase family protein [Leptolyngbya sp. SIOISBB]
MIKKVRHIMGLSGGKDSTALAVLLHKEIQGMEYFFCDTHRELPETYEYLDRIKARLGVNIHYLSAERDFDHWLALHSGYLPSPKRRWCTEQMKIRPLEKFVGEDEAISYVAIRADEDRSGYISTKNNIKAVFPFKDHDITLEGVYRLLEDSGIGLPKYYSWRTRSGCYFCFFQRKYEWVRLSEEHPDLFKKAIEYEQNHKDGRQYTWTDGETLLELIARKEQIIFDHEKAMLRKAKESPNKPLAEALETVLDEDDDLMPCLMCSY